MFKKFSAVSTWITLGSLALLTASANAAGIPGSAGSVSVSDGPNAEGLSFEATINYEAFSGTSPTDPLGLTPGQTQYAFIIEYIAGNEPLSTLDIESQFGVPIIATATSTVGTVNGIPAGTVAPSASGVVTLNNNPAARFLFLDADQEPNLGPGQVVSVILVFTADSTNSKVDQGVAGVRDSSLSDAAVVIGPKPKRTCPPPPPHHCRPRPCYPPRHCDRNRWNCQRPPACDNDHGRDCRDNDRDCRDNDRDCRNNDRDCRNNDRDCRDNDRNRCNDDRNRGGSCWGR